MTLYSDIVKIELQKFDIACCDPTELSVVEEEEEGERKNKKSSNESQNRSMQKEKIYEGASIRQVHNTL